MKLVTVFIIKYNKIKMKNKYNFVEAEKKWKSFWEENEVYKFHPKRESNIYSIDTPPPTMSGKMHIGHAFSYTQQDIIARYKRMKGMNVFYPFGTDDNGLPTEKLVEKENKVKLFEMKREDFISLCQKTIKKIRPDFVRDWKDVGMSCDFSLEYSTISKNVQKISQEYFLDLYKKKRTYRKDGPTIWCPLCQTAIAQAEMEDKEKEATFYNIAFDVDDKEIVIATTRPELLGSCRAIFVNSKDERYKSFVGKNAKVPIFNEEVNIIEDDLADPEKGTGAVMCCTFGDVTDMEWFYSHNLSPKICIGKEGKLNEKAGKYKGLSIENARKEIVKDLKSENKIKEEKKINHTVNIHERCQTPIEIISTNQWFIKYLDLKKDFLQMGEDLSWIPSHFRARYKNWINGLKWDWCISRQRYFGIPFPVWYCKHCDREVVAENSDLPVDPFSTSPKKSCCNKRDFVPDKNVLDTWATSALTPQIVQDLVKKENASVFPMSLRPQSHDIINFWLFYTIVRSKIHFDKLPWKSTVISGFVLDEKGEKMSKSKGNVVSPQKVISDYGADALRYWSSSIGFGEDIRWSEKEIKSAQRTLVKIWNAAKFSIINLEDYNPKGEDQEVKLEEEDKWLLFRLSNTVNLYEDYFEKYQYQKARKVIDSFFWNDFCGNYIEMTKKRFYEKKRNIEGAKLTIYKALLSIIKLYAPFIPFLTEEIYQEYFKKFEKEISIHRALILKIENNFLFPSDAKIVDEAVEIIAAVRKFKSEKNISVKEKIKMIIIDTSDKEIEKVFETIKDTLSVESISFGKGDTAVNENISIKVNI